MNMFTLLLWDDYADYVDKHCGQWNNWCWSVYFLLFVLALSIFSRSDESLGAIFVRDVRVPVCTVFTLRSCAKGRTIATERDIISIF